MQHDLRISGQAFRLEPATLPHAQFIFNLRRDPALNGFIHETPDDYQLHLAWMHRYFERPDDFYFIVVSEHDGTLQGTCAIYNRDRTASRAEWGRWLISPDSLAAAESAFLLYSLAFETLKLRELVCTTLESNKKVLSFHTACGLRVNKVEYNAVEHSLDLKAWMRLKPLLMIKCKRVAELIQSRN